MGAHTRTMAACLADATRDLATVIHDDPALQALHDAEHAAREAACAACEAVGLLPEMMGELKL
jgi:hypothetical protein